MKCREYRPDHNGECLNCDEPYSEHLEVLDPILQREIRFWLAAVHDASAIDDLRFFIRALIAAIRAGGIAGR